MNVRIFRHNFVGDKAKIRRRAVALQGFLTQSPAKFDENTCMNPYMDRFLVLFRNYPAQFNHIKDIEPAVAVNIIISGSTLLAKKCVSAAYKVSYIYLAVLVQVACLELDNYCSFGSCGSFSGGFGGSCS